CGIPNKDCRPVVAVSAQRCTQSPKMPRVLTLMRCVCFAPALDSTVSAYSPSLLGERTRQVTGLKRLAESPGKGGTVCVGFPSANSNPGGSISLTVWPGRGLLT